MNSNQPSTTSSSISSSQGASADSVSRRAYEIWEQQGKPDGCDLEHWLKAEQELSGSKSGVVQSNSRVNASSPPGSDANPLQGTRAAAAAGRDNKTRQFSAPYGTEKTGAANGRPSAVVSRK